MGLGYTSSLVATCHVICQLSVFFLLHLLGCVSVSLSDSGAGSLSFSLSLSLTVSLSLWGEGVVGAATTVLGGGDPVCPRSFFEPPFPHNTIVDSEPDPSWAAFAQARIESVGGWGREEGGRVRGRTIPFLCVALSFRAPWSLGSAVCSSSLSVSLLFLTVYSPPSPASSGPGRGAGG